MIGFNIYYVSLIGNKLLQFWAYKSGRIKFAFTAVSHTYSIVITVYLDNSFWLNGEERAFVFFGWFIRLSIHANHCYIQRMRFINMYGSMVLFVVIFGYISVFGYFGMWTFVLLVLKDFAMKSVQINMS